MYMYVLFIFAILVFFRLAMKLLDKKRIKVKKGEYLAVNERNMLAKVHVYTCTCICYKDCVLSCSATVYTALITLHGVPIHYGHIYVFSRAL